MSIAGTALILMFLLVGCNASETPILTISMANLSINLTPNYNISSAPIASTGDGYVGQAIVINNTEKLNDSTMISILSFSDMSVLELDSDEMLTFMDNMLLGVFRLAGADVVETYNLSSHYNQNVTVTAFNIPDPEDTTSSDLVYITSLRLDQLNYLYIMSSDRNLTNSIVESLVLVE